VSGQRCKYHCRSCSSCFSSLVAFDSHRGGGQCWNGRAAEKLRVQTEAGICEADAHRCEGVTIYEHGPSANRGRDFRRAPRLRSGGSPNTARNGSDDQRAGSAKTSRENAL
jgi:hypothetical protein